jgi:hypothetical protein
MLVVRMERTFSIVQETSGTAYRLVVTFDANKNIKSIAWPDMRWSAGDFGREVSEHWIRTTGRLKNKIDAKNIAEIVNHLANTLED